MHITYYMSHETRWTGRFKQSHRAYSDVIHFVIIAQAVYVCNAKSSYGDVETNQTRCRVVTWFESMNGASEMYGIKMREYRFSTGD